MRVIDLFKKTAFRYPRKINSLPKSYRSLISLVVTLFILAAIPLTVAFTPQGRSLFSRAFEPVGTIQCKESKPLEIGTRPIEENPQYLKKRLSETTDKASRGVTQNLDERKDLLIQTMRQDPKVAKKLILNKQERENLQSKTNNCIESEVTVEGEYRASYADFKDAPVLYEELITREGKSILLHKSTNYKFKVESSNKVKIKGFLLDNDLLFDPSSATNFQIASENPSKKVLPISPKNHRGTKQLIVGLVDFTNLSVPLTKVQAEDLVLSRTRSFYREASYFRMDIAGSSYGSYNYGTMTCNLGEITTKFIDSVDPLVNFNNVDSVSLFVNAPGCAGGLGYLGEPSWDTQEGFKQFGTYYVNVGSVPQNEAEMDYLSEVSEHELGHNLGAGHANFLNCGSVSIAATGCTSEAYGDHYSIMGYLGEHMSSIHKEAFGWFDTGEIVEPTVSGNHTITPLSTTGGLKVLKIPRGNGDFLYVQYRQPVGYDAEIFDPGNVFDGAQINIYYDVNYVESNLIDTSPPADVYSSSLTVGNTFTDPLSGIVVKVNSASSSGVSVAVTIPGSPAEPDLTSSSLSQSISSPVTGSNMTFSGNINNSASGATAGVSKARFCIDNLSCRTSTAGRIGSDVSVSTLNPGASDSIITLSIWSATEGSHTVYLCANVGTSPISESNTSNNCTSRSFTVTQPADTQNPTVNITSPSSNSFVAGTSEVVIANATDNVGVTKVEFFLDGSATPSRTDTVSPYTWSWNTTTSSNGNHTLTAKAYDAANNSKTSTAVNVTVDNQNPSLTITNPTNGTTVSDTVSVTASASDGHSGIDYVEFLIDGSVKKTDPSVPYTFSWDTTIYANGSHMIAVNAWDFAGNFTTKNITVTVNNVQPDTQPPSTPTGLTANAVSPTQVNLTWNPSTDDIGVVGYKVYRNGKIIASPSGTSFGDGTVNANTTYTYRVSAVDAATNESSQSTAKTVTTPNPADTQNPVVTITTPANGAKLSNTVTITATATDNVGVTGMTLFVGGQQKAISITGSISYSWGTTTVANGVYVILVNAIDAAGNPGTRSISVNVSNQISPPLEGDLNDDGKVNIFDASIVTSKWGTSDPQADINGDGIVNIFDASILTANWTS